MNDEYLWQKTGTDPEIEKLEKKLDVFRYRETPLNIPVVENVVETARVPRWRISLAFAFAASAMAGVLAAVVLFNFQTRPRLKLCSLQAPNSKPHRLRLRCSDRRKENDDGSESGPAIRGDQTQQDHSHSICFGAKTEIQRRKTKY
jgi:hypothetical protein